MSYYNVLAIFNEIQLLEVETILNQMSIMTQGYKNQLVKAVEDYQYLSTNSSCTRGLTKQIILFLLNSDSTTPEGIELFLSKLETWLEIVESKKEQRIYAEVVNKYRDSLYYYDEEVLALRFSLIDILHELEEDKAEKKRKKQRDNWERDSRLTQYEVPMQFHPEFEEYEAQMRAYGKSFESSTSSFNHVPNVKLLFNEEQPSYEETYLGIFGNVSN